MPLKRTRIVRNCLLCGAEFSVRPYRTDAKYCSNSCRTTVRPKVEVVCAYCGSLFLTHPSHPRIYCSLPCKFAGSKAKVVERFWSKVDKSGGADACWLWIPNAGAGRYGQIDVGKKRVGAHRFSWELANGPIPDGLIVLHNCPGGDNKACVNPAHLRAGTYADNSHDAVRKGQVPCGERHGSRTKPECIRRGDNHPAHLHPERMARGDRNGARLHPERIARGESCTHAKLTEQQVREIRERYAQGGILCREIATKYGVSKSLIVQIVARKTWRHLD